MAQLIVRLTHNHWYCPVGGRVTFKEHGLFFWNLHIFVLIMTKFLFHSTARKWNRSNSSLNWNQAISLPGLLMFTLITYKAMQGRDLFKVKPICNYKPLSWICYWALQRCWSEKASPLGSFSSHINLLTVISYLEYELLLSFVANIQSSSFSPSSPGCCSRDCRDDAPARARP